MLKLYLRKAPTILVIGISGFAAWPAIFPEGGSPLSKASPKPPASTKGAPSVVGPSDRDPFQVVKLSGATAILAATSAAQGPPTSPKSSKLAVLADLPADEDQILAGMKLGGTFIDGREQIAVIDNKVYSRGDRLRRPDGSLLPYVIIEVRKDRALLRRERRNFVLSFSDVPRTGTPRAEVSALAKSAAPARAEPVARVESGVLKKSPSPSGRPGGNAADPAAMLLQMLSGAGGASGSGGGSGSGLAGASAASTLAGALGGASGTNLGSSGIPINESTIAAGLEALSGKFDNIGRSGDTSSASGGSTP